MDTLDDNEVRKWSSSDISKYCLYVKINDSSYIDKLKSSFNLIKSINSEVSIGFLKEKNDNDEDENIIELYITGQFDGSINVYIKHVLSADEKNFKCLNSITKNNEIVINIKTDDICDIFKVIQSNTLLSMYMYNEYDTLYLQEQESNKRTICNEIQTMEKKENMTTSKSLNFKEKNIKAKVIMDAEELSSLLKRRFKKSGSSIIIRLTKEAITFSSNSISSPNMHSITNSIKITYPKSENVFIDFKDKNIEIIESNYIYANLEFLKNIKSQYYTKVILLFIQLHDNNYVIQFIYAGMGDKIYDDQIKITVLPCILDRTDNFNNDNQINYND